MLTFNAANIAKFEEDIWESVVRIKAKRPKWGYWYALGDPTYNYNRNKFTANCGGPLIALAVDRNPPYDENRRVLQRWKNEGYTFSKQNGIDVNVHLDWEEFATCIARQYALSAEFVRNVSEGLRLPVKRNHIVDLPDAPQSDATEGRALGIRLYAVVVKTLFP